MRTLDNEAFPESDSRVLRMLFKLNPVSTISLLAILAIHPSVTSGDNLSVHIYAADRGKSYSSPVFIGIRFLDLNDLSCRQKLTVNRFACLPKA